MSMINWNIRGFNSNRDQIRVLLKENNASIICLQETMLGDNVPNIGLDYLFYRSPPMVGMRAEGGTAIIINKSVNHKPVQLNTPLQACAVQFFTNKWITLCSVYLEPSLEKRLRDENGLPRRLHLNDLQSLVDQLSQPYILTGDFNARHSLWGEQTFNSWGYIVEGFIDQNDIVLMNDGSPTRHDVAHNSKSAIDLTFCSPSLRLDYEWSVDNDLHGSDHWPIHIKYVRNLPSPCQPKWKTDEADWGSFTINTKVDRVATEFPSPFAAYEYLVSILLCGAMLSIPKTLGNPRRAVVPWWNDTCATSRKIARACYKRYNRYPCMVNKITYRRALAKQKKTFKEARRNSFIKYISELKHDSPITLVWTRIRKLMGKFTPSPLPVLKINGSWISDPKEVAEAFERHFSDISSASHYNNNFSSIRNNTTVVPRFSNNSEVYNFLFTMEELDYALSSCSPTSPGEDEILYLMVINLSTSSKKFFLDVLNQFWNSGTSPDSWKISIIVPILKPGKDSSLPSGYRPIALTSCVCKIYEKMVTNNLVWYLESKNLLSVR